MGYRRFADAILRLARTASPWRDLPPELGNWKTTHCRFRRWSLRVIAVSQSSSSRSKAPKAFGRIARTWSWAFTSGGIRIVRVPAWCGASATEVTRPARQQTDAGLVDADSSVGQRHGADQHGDLALVRGAARGLALHRARQVDPRHAFAESFIGRLRDECLNETLFSSLPHARVALAAWRSDCNRVCPHSALGGTSPAAFAEKIRLAQEAA